MGDISYHFSRRDFQCRCGECNREFKISLNLVGYLEHIRNHFHRRVEILKGYQCEKAVSKQGLIKNNWHKRGKAVVIHVQGVAPQEVFLFAEKFPRARGLGLDLDNRAVYLDLRDTEPAKFIKEKGVEKELTPELRESYRLIPKKEQAKVSHGR